MNGNPIGFVDPLGLRSLTIVYGEGGIDIPETWIYTHLTNPTDDYITAKTPTELKSKLQSYTDQFPQAEPFEEVRIFVHGTSTSLGYENSDNISIFPQSGPGGPSEIENVFSPLKNRPPECLLIGACHTGQQRSGGNVAQNLKVLCQG